MSLTTLILRGLLHYWRWHLGLFAGVAAAAAVISGSLITGDSVRATLRHQAELRLGRAGAAVVSADGYFTEDLPGRMAAAGFPGMLAPALVLEATAAPPDGGRRANSVNLFGVTDAFWSLGTEGGPPEGDGATISRALAETLQIGAGSELILRFEKPGLLSRDAPLSGESDLTITLRTTVSGIRSDAALGAFSLKADQEPPLTVYLPLTKLQEAAELPGKANLLLTDSTETESLPAALSAAMTPEDAGLTWKEAGDRRILSTGRIFLAPRIADAAQEAFPEARGVLTYLVNEIRNSAGGITPYSMASAAEPGTSGLPEEWPAGSVLVTQWLADDLNVKPGDRISIRYYRVTRARLLEEAEESFSVHAVLPMDHPAVNREWTPDFPGVTESTSCRDWKPGIPIRQDIIRDRDDAYWREFRGTPKLFLHLTDGQRLWENRFGNLTSLHLPSAAPPGELAAALMKHLTPGDAGLRTVGLREQAAQAVSQSMDFGALFVSMSSFLIATALLLAVLLFALGVAQRAPQIGLLLATGWSAPRVRRMFLGESAIVCLPAAAAGVPAGILYTRWTLGRLETDWSDAALGLRFVHAIEPRTLVIAFLSTFLLALACVWWMTRRVGQPAPRALLSGEWSDGSSMASVSPARPRRWWRRIRIPPGACAVVAAGLLAAGTRMPQHLAPMMFFGAAALLLVDGLRLLGRRLRGMEQAAGSSPPGVWQLGVRNAVRRRARSMAVAGLLAAGIFMVVALNAFRQDARLLPSDRQAGTGGFALIGETTLPVYDDLNSPQGQETLGFDPDETAGVSVVAFRARDGEEASCLNLNRAQTPRVLGVDPEELASRKAFPFAGTARGIRPEPGASEWSLLDSEPEPGVIPAIMDQYSAMFALGKMAGDDVTVPDAQGRPVRLRLVALLAGTVLQGNVIISSRNFAALYPDTGGSRWFLIDGSPEALSRWEPAAMQLLAHRGLSLTPAADRLARFQAVQNTYLTIFSTLGGMALLLSTAALGVLVARHVLERRSEFALLQAVGLRRGQLRRMVVAEHGFLLLAAAVLGSATALIAVAPNLRLAGAGGIPVSLLAAIVSGLIATGLFFCWLAASLVTRGTLTSSLRHE